MIEYLKFHVAKMLAEAALGFLILFVMCSPLLWLLAKDMWKQWRCKHPGFREAERCNARCTVCNKMLGFIGTVRSQYDNR